MNNEANELKEQLLQSLFRVKSLSTAFPPGADEYMEKLNISIAEFVLMKAIEDNTLDSNENIQISDIQKYLFITKAAVSKMLGVLEKKGYVNRDIDQKNRRKLIITLTPKGKDVLKHTDKSFDDLLAKVISELGADDTKQFARIINRLADILKDLSNLQTLEGDSYACFND